MVKQTRMHTLVCVTVAVLFAVAVVSCSDQQERQRELPTSPRLDVASDDCPEWEPDCISMEPTQQQKSEIRSIIENQITCPSARTWLIMMLESGDLLLGSSPTWSRAGDWHWDHLVHINARYWTDPSWDRKGLAWTLAHEWGHHNNWNGIMYDPSGSDEVAASNFAWECTL